MPRIRLVNPHPRVCLDRPTTLTPEMPQRKCFLLRPPLSLVLLLDVTPDVGVGRFVRALGTVDGYLGEILSHEGRHRKGGSEEGTTTIFDAALEYCLRVARGFLGLGLYVDLY
jgi:hypothetical protein